MLFKVRWLNLLLWPAVARVQATWTPVVETLDSGTTNPGFTTGFLEGNNVYLAPLATNTQVTRFDGASFANPSHLDVSEPSWTGAFSDGTHGYMCQFSHVGGDYGGRVTRFSLQTFDTSSIKVLNLESVNSRYHAFWGGFSDGTHGYCIQMRSQASAGSSTTTDGRVVRFSFADFTTNSVEAIDLTTVDATFKWNRFGFFHESAAGSFAYICSRAVPKVMRFNTANFATSSVETLTFPATGGFRASLHDGTYGYMVPNTDGVICRFNLQNFNDPQCLDLAASDSSLVSWDSGWSDGTYGYVAKLRGSVIARFSLATFSNVESYDMTNVDARCTDFWGTLAGGGWAYLLSYSETLVCRVKFDDPAPGASMTSISALTATESTTSSSETSSITTTSTPTATASSTSSSSKTASSSTLTMTTSSSSSMSSTSSSTSSLTSSSSSSSRSSSSSSSSSTSSTSSFSSSTSSSLSTSSSSSSTLSSTSTSSSSSSLSSSSSTSSTSSLTTTTSSKTTSTSSATTSTSSSSTSSTTTSTTTTVQGYEVINVEVQGLNFTALKALEHAVAAAAAAAILNVTGGDERLLQTAVLSRGGIAVLETTIPSEPAAAEGMVAGLRSMQAMSALEKVMREKLLAMPALQAMLVSGQNLLVLAATHHVEMRPVTLTVPLSQEVVTTVQISGLTEQAWESQTAAFGAIIQAWEAAIASSVGNHRNVSRMSIVDSGDVRTLQTVTTLDAAVAGSVVEALQEGAAALRSALEKAIQDEGLGTEVEIGDVVTSGAPSSAQARVEEVLTLVEKETYHALRELQHRHADNYTVASGSGSIFAVRLSALSAAADAANATDGSSGMVEVPLPADLGMQLRLPVEIFAKYGYAKERKAVLVRVFNDSGPGLDSTSPPVSVKAYASIELRWFSGHALTVEGLEKTIEFSLPSPYVPRLQCAFWDETSTSWSHEGVTAGAEVALGKDMLCKTRHLSLFGAILEGIVSTLVCSNFALFNAEAVANIGKGTWYKSPGSLVCWFVLAIVLLSFAYAALLDRRRRLRFQWSDEFLLFAQGTKPALDVEAAQAKAEEPEEEQRSSPCGGLALCLASLACLRETSGLQDAIHDIVAEWFSYWNEVRACLGECTAAFAEVEAEAMRTGWFAVFARKLTTSMVLRHSRSAVGSLMGVSDRLLETIMDDEDLSTFLVDRLLVNRRLRGAVDGGESVPKQELANTPDSAATSAQNTQGPATPAGSWLAASNQWDAWRMLHAEISHEVVQHAAERDETPLVCVVGTAFLMHNPVGAAFSFDVFESCTVRVLVVAAEFYGALVFSCLFFQGAGGVKGKKISEECEAAGDNDSFGFLIGRTIVLALGSIIIAELPVMFLTSLQTKGLRWIDYRGSPAWQRQLRKWVIQERIMWSFGILYLCACIFFLMLFLANIGDEDHGEWSLVGLLTILQDFIVLPLFTACFLPLMAKGLLSAYSWWTKMPKEHVHRHAMETLHRSSNVMLPITSV